MSPGDGRPIPTATALSTEEQLLRESVQTFAARVVRPLVREMDSTGTMPRPLIDRLFELGLMGMCVPEDLGGTGARFTHVIVAVEALSAVDPSVGLIVDVQNTLVVGALRRWGSRRQQERWLPGLVSHQVGAYALSEADSGSDAFSLQTMARRVDGGYQLSGRKLWITNAADAEIFLVFATIDRSQRHRGVTAFIIPRSNPGLTVGRREDKLGIRASSTCELLLSDCTVPDDQVLGDVGLGYKVAIETLNEGRIGIGAQMVGLAAGALAHAVRHARDRRQFGRPLSEFQAVRFQLARMAADVEAARLMVYHAARLCDAGMPLQTEAAMCKLVASETAERVASQAVNLLGAAGFVKDGAVEKLFRDAKVGQIYEGTSNLLLETIAKQLL